MMKLDCYGIDCTFVDVWYLNAKVIYRCAVRVSKDIVCIPRVPGHFGIGGFVHHEC